MNLFDYLAKENITQLDAAKVLGVSQGAFSQWMLPNRRIPAEHCPVLERFSNRQVTCEEMRPDIDWAFLRVTPNPESSIDVALTRTTKPRRVVTRRQISK